MEYKINDYIDIQPLYEGKTLVLNKKNGQSFELGAKESAVLVLLDGIKSPSDISNLCEFFSEEEIIALEKQFFELEIIGKEKAKTKINFIKMKIPLFSPNKIFGSNRVLTKVTYSLFVSINSLFFLAGIVLSIRNIICGISNEKILFIESFTSFQNFETNDFIYAVLFFLASLVLHEFGHMIVARKNNINIPDVGVMLYLFIPCAYTNLTFLNYCDNKITKLKVFFAGSLSDFGLLGISMTLFYLIDQGTIAKAALISALLSMVSITGNLVVTFKFDGYYILQTLLETDNLQKNSVALVILYIKMIYTKIRNKDKKLSIHQISNSDINLETLFSLIYIILSLVYIPVIIGSGIVTTIIELGGTLL